MSFTIGSLFDGSGGFPLTAYLCGGATLWASEVEPYPIAVTKSRFPNMLHLGDISKVKGNEIAPVDVITFGSPCQDLSVAGKRAGLKHIENGDEETTRSGLFMEAVRIIKEMRQATNGLYPTFAIWENVPGAFSSNKGQDFRAVLEELIKIAEPKAPALPMPAKNNWPYADVIMGDKWSLAWRVFDAQYWGVPQRRRRIYIVADFGGQRAAKILFERKGLRGYFTQSGTQRQTTAGNTEKSVATNDKKGNCIAVDQGGGKSSANFYNNLAPTLTCTHGGEPAGAYVETETPPYTLKIRSGCEGGGKGALVQTDKSATLATNNDQYLFQPMCYDARGNGIDTVYTAGFCPEQGEKTRSIGYEKEKSPTLRAGAVPAICKAIPLAPVAAFLTDKGDTSFSIGYSVEQSPTLRTIHPPAICKAIPIHDQATRFAGKRGSKQDGKGNGLGVGQPGDPMNTLTSADRHAVAFSQQDYDKYLEADKASTLKAEGGNYGGGSENIVAFWNGQQICSTLTANNAGGSQRMPDKENFNCVIQAVDCRNGTENDTNGALQSMASNNINSNNTVRINYIVRRLTPTECARLQGFPDWWGKIDPKEDLTAEEFKFWHDVRNTHAAINNKQVKEYTKTQMLTWYNKLHTDSSEYKMWGNGIALPTALYIMQGIAEEIK